VREYTKMQTMTWWKSD